MAILKYLIPVSGSAIAIAAAAALSMALLPMPAQAETVCTDGRLSYANHLIFDSSASKQVTQSDSADAQALLEEAKSLYASAETEADAEVCKGLISQSLTTMFKAVKASKPESASGAKHLQDFSNKEKSVNALLDALEYITEESHDEKKFAQLKIDTLKLFDKAYLLKDGGKVVDGTHVLEEAIVLLKTEIQVLREGVTLVRSLNFATKEEEYEYEIDRNDTHRMLVDVLLKEKRESSDRVDDKVKAYMDKADASRLAAEDAAKAKDFEKGIELLEQSTQEIVRAIRSAGVYIPG